MNKLSDLIEMSNDGSVLESLSTRFLELIEQGPMAHIRETYCMRAKVEKDLMKSQNMTRRHHDELKLHKDIMEQINERIDKLDTIFLREDKFQIEIKPYAKRADI